MIPLRRSIVVALVGLLVATGCSALSAAPAGYHLTATFPKTVAFYNHSKVKLMGVNVGEVNSVTIEPDQVRVGFTVNKGVPLPSDVHAAIFPASIIGERNLTLFPPWSPGKPLARDGDVIPASRTQIPIEVDDVLKSVTQLANAINPADVSHLVTGASKSLHGHGSDLGSAIQQATALSGTLASQDQELVATAASIHQLAATLNARQQKLGAVIDDFSQATGLLANERQQLTALLAAFVSLSQQGQQLVSGLQQQLPVDLANLAKVVLTVQANATGLAQFVAALPHIATVIIESYSPTYDLFRLQFDLPASARPILFCALSSLNIAGLQNAIAALAPGTRCP